MKERKKHDRESIERKKTRMVQTAPTFIRGNTSDEGTEKRRKIIKETKRRPETSLVEVYSERI